MFNKLDNYSLSHSEQKILYFLSSSLITVYLIQIIYNIFSSFLIPIRGAIDLCYYCFDQFPISKNIPRIQFFLIPILFFSILRIKNLLIQFLLSFTVISLYFYWIYETFAGRRMFEIFSLETETIFSYLMNDSTIFDFSFFIIISIIFILQSFFVFRFVIDKFQVKIS